MGKWPTLAALASADEADVHTAWAGLGYYSRGTRLWKGAQKVVNELGGRMPRTAEALQKQLPGVGPYTAAAIASIAFGERRGVVDGNVIRVFARLRAIGADSASDVAMKHFWRLADTVVDPDRPGDFNQALMELGATCCTPKSPSCGDCPIAAFCMARQDAAAKRTPAAGAATSCSLCLPSQEAATSSQQDDGYPAVTIYPRKRKKAPVLEQKVAVLLCQKPDVPSGGHEAAAPALLLTRRPAKGLMPNLWTFPLHVLEADAEDESQVSRQRLSVFLRSKSPGCSYARLFSSPSVRRSKRCALLWRRAFKFRG